MARSTGGREAVRATWERIMELRVMETDGRYSHVRLIGKMDAPGAQEIDAAFASAVAGPLRPAIVDMAEVPFLSSMGVRTLMQAIKALHPSGAKLVLLNPPAAVVKVLQTAGLGGHVPCAATLEEARALLGGVGVP